MVFCNGGFAWISCFFWDGSDDTLFASFGFFVLLLNLSA